MSELIFLSHIQNVKNEYKIEEKKKVEKLTYKCLSLDSNDKYKAHDKLSSNHRHLLDVNVPRSVSDDSRARFQYREKVLHSSLKQNKTYYSRVYCTDDMTIITEEMLQMMSTNPVTPGATIKAKDLGQ